MDGHANLVYSSAIAVGGPVGWAATSLCPPRWFRRFQAQTRALPASSWVFSRSATTPGAAGLTIVLLEGATKLVRELGLEVWLPFLGASKSDMYEVFAQVCARPHRLTPYWGIRA